MPPFDIHDECHRLKLLKDAGHTTLVESRGGGTCPVDGGFCVGRDAERFYVFTHPGNAVR